MGSLSTLLMVLSPLFIGFFIRVPKRYLPYIDKALSILVYLILAVIGASLASFNNLGQKVSTIITATTILFISVITLNILILMIFDRLNPWEYPSEQKKPEVSILSSFKQLLSVVLGYILGKLFIDIFAVPEVLCTYLLILLIFLVGLQLKGSGFSLKDVLLNKRGLQISILFIFSSLLGGLVFSSFMPEVTWSKGLALSSGFGWYSLSGIVMTNSYGAIWGSVAIINDLAREIFSLVFIPVLMKRYISAGIGVGGATSLDFTLPIIQSSGGVSVVPIAISFGFIVNFVAPILMVWFSSLG